MFRKVGLTLAAILVTDAARSEEVPDQIHAAQQVIRTTLLGKSMWAYERMQPRAQGAPGQVNSGKARFEEMEGKLIGHLENGERCDTEVKLQADGFGMATCAGEDRHYVRNGDEFKAVFRSYEYTIR